jgi:ATPase subunit of ABC transporter with duplicated ATPase domains
VITAQGISIQIGARTLLHPANFRIGGGDRIGLVGRNGAGKTTLLKALAGATATGDAIATNGQIIRTDSIGYLPQDTLVEDPHRVGMDHVLSARGLDFLTKEMAATEALMTSPDPDVMAKALDRYPKLEARFIAAGGYAAESEAHRIVSNLGITDRVLSSEIGHLSGGQRRRLELARILFSGAATLLLDEPTNHLDTDAVAWLRDYLKTYPGGFIVISHDIELLRASANKIWYLDANRATLDQYNLNWDAYVIEREQEEKRRRRERANAEKKAAALLAQAESMRAKATKAVAAQQMIKRAEEMLAATQTERAQEKVAKLRFPSPAPCGKVPLLAEDLSKYYGSLEVFTGVDLAIDKGSRVVVLGLNGAGKTTLLRLLSGVEDSDTGKVIPGHGLKLGYYAQEHDQLDRFATVFENLRAVAPEMTDTQVRTVLGSFLFSGEDAEKPAYVLSGGEKTRLALATLVVSRANVLLLDEPTNNLDPASREEILGALRTYEGAIVMVTHDEGAVDALGPERVLILPDGDEDLWNESYRDLVTLA